MGGDRAWSLFAGRYDFTADTINVSGTPGAKAARS
jgi:hypothetical protein